MTHEEALVHVDRVAGRIIARSMEPGGVRHALLGAVLTGTRFPDETAVWRWLAAHTGLKALGRSDAK